MTIKWLPAFLALAMPQIAIANPTDAAREQVNIASELAIFATAAAMKAAIDCDNPEMAAREKSIINTLAKSIITDHGLWERKIDAELNRISGYGIVLDHQKDKCDQEDHIRNLDHFMAVSDRLKSAIEFYWE